MHKPSFHSLSPLYLKLQPFALETLIATVSTRIIDAKNTIFCPLFRVSVYIVSKKLKIVALIFEKIFHAINMLLLTKTPPDFYIKRRFLGFFEKSCVTEQSFLHIICIVHNNKNK